LVIERPLSVLENERDIIGQGDEPYDGPAWNVAHVGKAIKRKCDEMVDSWQKALNIQGRLNR
jgi:hypothetical protein